MKKRFLALAIVLGAGLLSGCTNAGEKTAVSYKGGTISEQEVMDSLKKMQGADSTVQQLIVYQYLKTNTEMTYQLKKSILNMIKQRNNWVIHLIHN